MAYGSDEAFQQWLDEQGIDLPSGRPSIANLRARGSAHIDAIYGGRFVGAPASVDQPNLWPRTGAAAYGRAIPDDIIPLAVIHASYRAAVVEANGVSLSRTFDPTVAQVKREKVDVLETEYFAAPTNAAAAVPVVAGLDGLLAPFLKAEGARALGMWVI